MRRWIAGLGFINLFTAGVIRAEEPWRSSTISKPASLVVPSNTPRVGLGLPEPVGSPINPASTPAVSFGTPTRIEAISTTPIIRGQLPDLPPPDLLGIETPKEMPKATITEGKGTGKSPQILPDPKKSTPFTGTPSVYNPLPGCDPVSGPTTNLEMLDPAAAYQPRVVFTAEYLLWFTRRFNAPVLLSTGATSPSSILGAGGVPLIGGGPIGNSSPASGFRLGGIYWCDPVCRWGFDGNYFSLGRQVTNQFYGSGQFPVLTRPFFNVNAGQESGERIAAPGLSTGSAVVHTERSLWGAELNFRKGCWGGCNWNLDWIAGYRYLNLDEALVVGENFSGIRAPGANLVQSGSIVDSFRTNNQFHGGQVGLVWSGQRGRWSIESRAKIAFGETFSTVDTAGGLAFTSGGGTINNPGGLLVLNSNSGHFTHTAFSVVPEVTFNIGYDITSHCRVFVGYNFLYWSNVLRPGDQIDRGLDVSRIPNFTNTTIPNLATTRPVIPFRETDFWAQGVNFGLRLNW